MYYFASDIHLGGGDTALRIATEQRFLSWLEMVSCDAEAIFLCGDIFDFWFEYRSTIPDGYDRVLEQITALTSRGIRIIFVTGNHDMWVLDHLSRVCGAELCTRPAIYTLAGKRVHVAHGDNLNVRGDWKLTLINTIFRSHLAYTLTRWFIPPRHIYRFGRWWSNSSRKRHYEGEGQDTIDGYGVRSLVDYAHTAQQREACDYFVYGHLHQHLTIEGEGYKIFFMNDWSSLPYYITLDEAGQMELKKYEAR